MIGVRNDLGIRGREFSKDRMQPTAAASLPVQGEMDIQAMQSMDWLFKKERIYLLAQFWQQRATLAEKEVSTLKEQLSGSTQIPEAREGNHCTSENKMDLISRANIDIELAAKDKEISQLLEEVQRLQGSLAALQESHSAQIQRLEERLDAKRQHIARLESKLDRQRDYEDIKRENSLLRSVDLSSAADSKHFEQLLIERNKAIAQADALKSSSQCEGQPNLQQSVLPTPSLQNVETFGSFLGEEIVSNWRRSIDRNIMLNNNNQNIQQQQQQHHQNQQPQSQQIISSTDVAASINQSSSSATTPLPDNDKSISAASTPAPLDPLPSTPRLPESSPAGELNGGPKSPLEDNNNLHLSNNNLHGTPLGALSIASGLFRPDDKSSLSFRFDERSGPFRFADEMNNLAPGAMVGRLGESLIPKGDPMEARLQEMLRYNMDKYANQNLDTLHISRRVRELLSVHNIGQRLFAKYVLGLSQGTVSELLSKPKPWDKLTEKGRDSYRKMHAWACDDNAVLMLKSLIPKKGKEPGMPSFGRPDGDMTDERLAHILSEASHFIKAPNQGEDSHSNEDSKSPQLQCPSPYPKDSSQNRRLKKYENDDIPQEKVTRIYQEELAKLMGRRMEDLQRPREAFPSMLFPHFFSGAGPPGMERAPDDNIRMTIEAYHRELMKMQQTGGNLPSLPNIPGIPNLLALQQQAAMAQNPHLNGAQDLSLPKEKLAKMVNGDIRDMYEKEKEMEAEAMRHAGSAFSLVRPKQEPNTTSSSASSPLGNTILPPAMTPTEEFTGPAAASPLQRMASITNSLISQPPNPSHHNQTQRPLKAVLPPITQQQFDMFNNLNTEDIVRRVKESLSQYSISQRLFGESVLGLSQGSVSDLLARPKPWHMLTQKGREPFIRMKMFLEDENAVHKLVASQYKIAPEKLMRTGSYSGNPQCPTSLGKPLPPTPKMISDATSILSKMQHDQNALLPPSLQLVHQSQNQSIPTSQAPMLLTPPGIPPHHAINLQQSQSNEMMKSKQMVHPVQHSPMSHHQPSSAMRALHQHISPSVYEMAALTQDLDTQTITTKIKEALLANNIGQKIFGEAVLGLSQGSVSELLSKPKPWHMLSIKGREPFIRMQLWLSDAHNVDRLQALKNERREANKRRRSSGPGAQDNSSDTSSNDTSEFYHSNSPGPNTSGPPSAKKQRVLFSEEQKEALRLAFALDPYPNVATIEFLAGELGLSTRTITNWFHNHRMRLKQQVPHGLPNEVPVRDQSGNQTPFDPVQFKLLLSQRLHELRNERMGLGAVPLPYPPYFAANTNLAALISRGLLPSGEVDLSALNNAVKEQISGLDLSMPSLKREPSNEEYEDEDAESNLGSEDEHSMEDDHDVKVETKEETPVQNLARSSRRKPAAPQWVNPEWQDEKEKGNTDEVIINGVCVMQTEDYRINSEETIRIEPTPVVDRFEDNVSEASESERPDAHSPVPDPSSEEHDKSETENISNMENEDHVPTEVEDEQRPIKTETETEAEEDDRWEY